LKESIRRAVFYLKKTQKQDGSWWGRWGTNYLYGTFSALLGLMQVKVDPEEEWVQKSIHFLIAKQNEDGGWGESCDTYASTLKQNQEKSTVFHTAIVLIALLYAGKVRSREVERGVFYLLSRKDNFKDAVCNAPGFPRVFYLKYHGYEVLFPLWALGLYRLKSKS
jgi:squalene-hopene/tetraprenyl-beta-curcumene cyclase